MRSHQAAIDHLDRLTTELRALERECQEVGGFLTSDWRSLRLRSLGEEIDELEERLMALEEGFDQFAWTR